MTYMYSGYYNSWFRFDASLRWVKCPPPYASQEFK